MIFMLCLLFLVGVVVVMVCVCFMFLSFETSFLDFGNLVFVKFLLYIFSSF